MTEAKADLSELMARVGCGGERFVIERRGRPLAALVGDLERLERENAPSRLLGATALIGAWDGAEELEVDTMLEEIYRESERDTGRTVDLGA